MSITIEKIITGVKIVGSVIKSVIDFINIFKKKKVGDEKIK